MTLRMPMPAPVCRLCMGPNPKWRQLAHGLYDAICDQCYGKSAKTADENAADPARAD